MHAGANTDGIPVETLRAINAEIGRSYDNLPYEAVGDAVSLPDPVFDVANAHGFGPQSRSNFSMLGLGCGTGERIVRIAERFPAASLHGVDISRLATDRARERCSRYGDRVRITCADLLDVQPAQLGRYDLIYAIGVVYIVPEPVRRHMLALIGRCLKPGGVAVVSYYTGPILLHRASVARYIRSAVPSGSIPEMIRAGRAHIQRMAGELPPSGALRDFMLAVLQSAMKQPDVNFFHEVFNEHFGVLTTGEMEAALQPQGVDFLTYLTPNPFEKEASSRARALGADLWDGTTGAGYRYAVFAKRKMPVLF